VEPIPDSKVNIPKINQVVSGPVAGSSPASAEAPRTAAVRSGFDGDGLVADAPATSPVLVPPDGVVELVVVVGEEEGLGAGVGVTEGAGDGVAEGSEEGSGVALGVRLGLAEGLVEGEADGLADGLAEGLGEGFSEGAGLREGVGEGDASGEITPLIWLSS
jgi:hypothetical protein